jgi:hypothetical protein
MRQGKGRARIRMPAVMAAMLVWLALGLPATTATAQPSGPIQSFPSLSSFSSGTHITQTITFDEFASGTALGNPANVGPVIFQHTTAATFKTEADAFAPVSPPNVLAPRQADGTGAFGDTYVTFSKRTRAVGLYLIIPLGFGETASFVSTVTVTDIENHSLTAFAIFSGGSGQQRFIGFKSQLQLAAVSFTPAAKSDGGSAVVALDNVMVD